MLGTNTKPQDGITTVIFSEKESELVPELKSAPSGRSGQRRRGLDQALRTVAVLQTTLEIEQLIKLFSREVSNNVPHSSITYQNDALDSEVSSGRNAKHVLSFELIVESKPLGQLTFTRGKPFDTRESALLEYMLCSLVYPLRNALQYRDAFTASMTDPLTGVYNRSMMEAALGRESALSRRHRTSLSLILLDIDNFKSINDTYGHRTGDDLIKAIAQTISTELRKTDMLARYGGDEFTVLLSNTNRRGATTLANNLCRKIQSTIYVANELEFNITVSMGVASTMATNKSGDIFSRADEALYQAKREGRNRVHVATN